MRGDSSGPSPLPCLSLCACPSAAVFWEVICEGTELLRRENEALVAVGYYNMKLSSGEASPRVLCPAPGSTVQEGHGAPRASPAEGYEDDEGTGASLIRGEAERAGPG